jgi:hypothetical protein
MRRDLGRLEVQGVLARREREIAVRVKGAETGTFRFHFAADGKLEGVEVAIGE